ncbi:error-prone, lesion bypass DNA polymerase V [Photobacterium aphoticum]|uniref:Error-prone, lesion bypass DNA polymerase V n=1 Tax=Photobacterium aphoticum TaxID=754436 RepID=A0A090QMD2_9GAMM|nr:error-prone, lesion bypass DNA polymerase V [Photobacterium aphoticum]
MFALVDANAFYCSAEQVFRPDWRGKPVIVLSNNDGCVVAANRQAKEAGVKKFKPYFEMRRLCEQKGVIACSSNYELYGDLSAKMMEVIGRFAPDQYVYSIDESFLSFQRCQQAIPDLAAHAHALRKAVWKECRLPVCVGMGSTLTLAKVANHAAKHISQYQGVCVLRQESERRAVLATMTAQDVWGIGARTAKRLRIMGIETALQLADLPPGLARKDFNVEIERTVRELNGEICKGWDEARADKQQIFSTRSVGERIVSEEALSQALCRQANIAAAKLRQQGSLCQVMMVFASNSPFDEKPVSRRFQYRFAYPTDDTCVMMQVIARAMADLFVPGVRFYKLGVGLIDLVDGQHAQFDLFDPQANNPALMQAFDGLNTKYGTGTVFVAAQGIAPKWAMRRDRLTPQYTTRWRDIPTIRC